jgi:uncharacterized secreted repeat protein (TIGR03808 family)
MLDRRRFLVSALAAGTVASLSRPALAQSDAALREGALSAETLGVRPNATDDQTAALQSAIERAIARGRALFIPPGRYVTSGLRLPSGAHLVGSPGSTRLLHTGGGHLMLADGADRVTLSHVVLDGRKLPLREGVRGLVQAERCRRLVIDNVEVFNSAASGIVFEGCNGRIERTTIADVADAAIFARDSRGLAIERNTITGAGNNGIQVWRRAAGDDGTLVSGNRIHQVRWAAGGNGQNGNGINVYRAGGVIVTNNHVADCAFSAIRNNAGANCQILGNSALRSGEVAIFVEFGFQGAVVANNLVDGAAAGISVTNFDHGGRLAVVQGNVVRNLSPRSAVNPDTSPYGIAAEADASMLGNVVEGSPGLGLLLGWGPYLRDVTATGNVVRRADIGIAVSVARGAGRAVVTDNVISETRRGAILGMEWQRIATRDFGREREGTHANLTFGRNSVS